MNEDAFSPDSPSKDDAISPRWILLGMFAILVAGGLAYIIFNKPVDPPPPEVARDPLLNQGRAIYLARCIACHGLDGKGDGPLAKNLIGPPPGNLTDAEWKHGANPEQVMRVIADGIPNTRMEGWGRVLDPPDLRAVASYVFFLAGKPVPQELRMP